MTLETWITGVKGLQTPPAEQVVGHRYSELGPTPAARGCAAGPRTSLPSGWCQRSPQLNVLDPFVERVKDYRATVTRCAESDVVAGVGQLLPDGARALLPPGLPWPVDGVVDEEFSALELDEFDAVVTAATVAVAETGTIVLTHGPAEGRRALSLVPDIHVCPTSS